MKARIFTLWAGLALAIAGAAPTVHAQYIPGATCPSHQWANAYGFTTGFACAQPSFADLSGVANAGQVSGAFAGFVNKLRGNSLSQWYAGTSVSITTSGGWAAEGVYIVPAGASVTASQVTSPQSGGPYYALKILGAASNTDVKLRLPIESLDAAILAGQTATFQITYQNKSGGSITPTLTTKYAGSQDAWGSPTTDLSAAAMQSCANNAICTAAYTLSVNAGANNGYTPTVDFGALGSGDYIEIIGFDMRVTPGVSTGANASPPSSEFVTASVDTDWSQRFFETSYGNGTAPGAAVGAGTNGLLFGANTSAGTLWATTPFATAKRCAAPTITVYDGTGASGVVSYNNGGGWNNGATPTIRTTKRFLNVTIAVVYLGFDFTADCRISGA